MSGYKEELAKALKRLGHDVDELFNRKEVDKLFLPIGGSMSETVQLGQVVLWKRWAALEGELCPAIVTKCHEDGSVNLTIFPDGEGMQMRTQVKQGSEAGEWRLV